MKIVNYKDRLQSQLVILHDEEWLTKQRVAGQCWREVFGVLSEFVRTTKNFSLRELDELGGAEIVKRNCYPTFLGYKGFPRNLCLSLNKSLVHGIGDDRKVEEGDVLTIDFGASFKGDGEKYAIADAASTFIIGQPKSNDHLRILQATRECLKNAITVARCGNRLGNIGYVIDRTAKNHGFNVVPGLGGHSLDYDRPHAFLFVPNKSDKEDGITIESGLTLAIEPLLVPVNSSTKCKTEADGWTISTEDIGSHEEATIFIHQDHTEIIAGPDYLYEASQ